MKLKDSRVSDLLSRHQVVKAARSTLRNKQQDKGCILVINDTEMKNHDSKIIAG